MPSIPRPEGPLSDGVVTMRLLRAEDVPLLVERMNDPEIARWTRVPSPYTEAHARAYMAEMEERRRSGREIAFVTTSADDGELLGTHNLRVTSWEHGRGELGAVVFPAARGRRVSGRAGRLLCIFGFDHVGLARIEIIADARNLAVQRLTEGFGMHRREAVLRSYMEVDGERVDAVMYGATPEDVIDAPD